MRSQKSGDPLFVGELNPWWSLPGDFGLIVFPNSEELELCTLTLQRFHQVHQIRVKQDWHEVAKLWSQRPQPTRSAARTSSVGRRQWLRLDPEHCQPQQESILPSEIVCGFCPVQIQSLAKPLSREYVVRHRVWKRVWWARERRQPGRN